MDILRRRERQRVQYLKTKLENPFHHRCAYIGCKARVFKAPFDLDGPYLETIWNGKCAISGMDIELHGDHALDSHAELDRFKPELGYVKGNVSWVSRKYNRLKGNGTIEEFETVLNYLRVREKYGHITN